MPCDFISSHKLVRFHVCMLFHSNILSFKFQVTLGKKANLIFLFFLLRKLILPFYSFTLFCIILPLTMFLPEAQLPPWVVCYVPGIMSILNILPAPRSFPFIVPYLLFENTMSVTKFNAMISGLFRFGSSYEWVVTKKLGRSSETDLVAFGEKESDPLVQTTNLHRSSSESGLDELNKLDTTNKTGKKKRNRLYRKELALALILLTASVRSLLSAQGIHFYFLLFQGISFLVVGLDLIGEQVSWPWDSNIQILLKALSRDLACDAIALMTMPFIHPKILELRSFLFGQWFFGYWLKQFVHLCSTEICILFIHLLVTGPLHHCGYQSTCFWLV